MEKFKEFINKSLSKSSVVLGVSALLVIGILITTNQIINKQKKTLFSHAGGIAPAVEMKEVANLPKPTNVKVWPDDKVATVSWNEVSGSNIVGYIVLYKKSTETEFTKLKQTIYTATQIQPLENGVQYNIEVRSVQGNVSQGYAIANGNVSPAVALTTTPSSSRVDAMKNRLTGFFDDFNDFPAGAFDELKWNFAVTACVELGEAGQFINTQLHGHNMVKSTCDRAGVVSRPRAIFDISGRTEANPAQIEFDMDGVSQPRDAWYIDLIPIDARKTLVPLDLTSHNDIFDADSEDPGRMIRINQRYDSVSLNYYDQNKNPNSINSTGCGYNVFCDMSNKTGSFSPLPVPNFNLPTIPNVRRHWVIQVSPTKIKVFIDGVLIGSGNMPALFANINKFVVHSTIFSYNTGKQSATTITPQTAMLHWDNFGFTAPLSGPSNIVTHNYLDGGSTGTIPMVALGTEQNPVPNNRTNVKIPVPDPIGTPVGKAKLMFTIQPRDFSYYNWSSNDHVLFNGKRYNLPNPATTVQSALNDIYIYTPHPTSIFIEPTDIKQGINDITLNIPTHIHNLHLEIDYDKNNAPSYTQPKDIFQNFTSFVQPVMRNGDDYLFVEQNMGLTAPMGSHGGTVVPTQPISPTPTPTTTPGGQTFTVNLSGSQEVPPNGSNTIGTAIITLNTANNTLSYNISYDSFVSAETAAHIHGFAATGVGGAGALHNLPSGKPKIGTWTYQESQEANILAGLTYINIHTSDFPNGEIRGQIIVPGQATPTFTPTPTRTPTPTPTRTPTPTTFPPTITPTGANCTKTGDINCDNSVALTDLSILLSNWNLTAPTNPKADINNSGRVDLTDLSILLSNWGL